MLLSQGTSEQVMILRQKISATQSQKQKREQQLKSMHQLQIMKIRSQTQIKVKLLVQNYQKQLQMLRKDIVIKSASLSDISDMTNQQKLQLLHTVQVLNNQIQRSMNEQKAVKAQLQKKIILQQIQYNDVVGEKNALNNRIQ